MNPKSVSARRSTQLGRVGTAPASVPADIPSALSDVPAAAREAVMRPRKQYAALEARILFDAAGAAAADHQFDDPAAQQREAQRIASEEARAATLVMDGSRENSAPTLPAVRGNTVVVIDSRVTDYQSLLAGVDPSATVRIVGRDEDGLQVISQLLGETGNVSSLQIVSHGQSGAIRLGNANLDTISLNDASVISQLQGWQSGMTANADILILGCDVAQGSKGEFFVQRLADLTQADISASTDDTGAASKGGNWVLEFDVGQRDSTFVFSQQAMQNYSELLPAGPTTTLSLPANTLIGAQNQAGSVTFDNTGTSVGYAPYVAVAFNSNRTAPLDPVSNVDEGISYVAGSGTYLGSALPDVALLTFDAAGNASSPAVVDPTTGLPIVFTAASYGMGAGDTLVIYQLPYGSFTPDNPPAKIDFKFNLGANADSSTPVAQGGEGAPAANISSKGFFLLGETPVAEAGDPVVMQGAASTATTNPIWYRTAYINSSREAEQVPGANDKQYFIAELEMAPNQTVLSNNGLVNAANPGATTDRYVARLSIPANINFDPAVDVTLNYNPTGTVASPSDTPIPGAQIFVVNRGTGTPALAGGADDGTTPNLPIRNALGVWVIARPTGGANDTKVDLIAIAPAGTSYTGGVLGLELNYFIPDTIIDPLTGADIPQSFDAKHTGNVKFADGDDPQNAPFVIDPAQVVIEYETIQIQKTVAGVTPNAIDPANPAGVRSGDILTYTLVVQVGDFYGLRNAIITDTLADGLEFEAGSMTVASGKVNGQVTTGIAVTPTVTTSTTNNFSQAVTVDIQNDESAAAIDVDGNAGNGVQVGGLGKQVLQFNLSTVIAGAAPNTGLNGAQAGDLIGDAFGNAAGSGLTTITITYRARVLDTYRVAQNGNITAPTGSQVLENDVLPNNARISGILLRDTDPSAAANIQTTGLVNADDSSATVTVKDGKLIQVIYAINGVLVGDSTIPKDPSGRPIIAAGDNVTYRLQYNLSQGDFNTLKLEAFLPDPIFQANDSDLNGSTNNFTAVTAPVNLTNGNAGSNWAQAGAFTLGPNHNQPDITLVNLATDVNTSTTTPGTGNSVGFEVFKSSSIPIASSANVVVDFLFTVKASDKPYADNLLLTSQGRETGQRSVNNNNGGVGNPVLQPTPLPDDQIIQIVRAEPRLVVSHGVIAKVAGQGGDITGNTGLGTVPDATTGTGTKPFSTTLTSASQINGNVTNVDAGDVLRMGFAIQNSGGAGAFDVKTAAITPPPGYKFLSGDANATAAANNFQVRTGAGVLLIAGTDYIVTGGNTIELVDGANTAKLGKGRNADGSTVTDGSNIIVITYDIVADDGTAAKAVAADNATSVLAVDSYASRNLGTDFTTTLNAGTGGQVRDDAQLEIARPQVDLRWQGDSSDNDPTATNDDSNQAHTTGADLVIGEKAYFDIKVTVPEGITNGLFADINLPAGLRLDTSYNGGIGYEIIQTTTGVGVNGRGVGTQLGANFAGTGVTVAAAGNIAAVDGGTLGNSDTNARISLGTITNNADNNSGNNSFIVRVRVVVDNEISNQQGATKTSASDAVFTDTDGATGNNVSEVRDIADTTTANDPTIAIVEPTVTTVKTVKIVDVDPAAGPDVPGPEADENDVVEFTILLTNSSTVKAWDLSLADQLPAQFVGYTLVSVDSAANPGTLTTSTNAFRNGAAVTLGVSDFAINAGVLSFAAGNNYDLDPAGTIRVTVRGTANASIAGFLTVNNDATTRWTSLDRSTGPNNTVGNIPAGERGGADNLLTGGSTINVSNGTSSGTAPDQASAGNGLNNYQTASRAVVPVVSTAPVLSRIGGLADTSPGANNNAGGVTSDGSPTGGIAQSMAVGEITRFRMVTRVPAGQIADFALTPTLPAGYAFLNDGTARVALVSDSGMTASGLTGNGVSAQLGDGTGSGNLDAFGTIQNNLSGPAPVRAAGTAPTVAITPNIATNGGSLVAPRFELGNITNSDNDTDFEYIVIEFNAVVKNDIANQSGTNLDTQFVVSAGATVLGTSNAVRDVVVEPNISNLSKTIVDFPSGAQNSTAPGSYAVTVQNSFASNGGTTAYDTQFRDSIPGATTASNVFVSLDGGATFVALAAFSDPALGRSGTITGGVVDLNLGDVLVGTNVVIKYDTVVPATNAAITAGPLTNAQVVFSSLPDIATASIGAAGFAGSTLTGDGTATGERNGTLVAQSTSPANDITNNGLLNNYRNVDPAGIATLSGTLWDDTNNANGNIDAGEKLLNGVTVTLLWAGADGTFGTSDDRTLTNVTDTNGKYTFGALPGDNPLTAGVSEGRYRITAPATVTRTDSGDGADTDELTPRFDRTDGTAAGSLNVAELVIGDGSTTPIRDFGYVQPNDAPVNSFNGSSTFPTAATPVATVEDIPFAFTVANSARITIADPDGNQGTGLLTTTVAAADGTLAATNGSGTATVTNSGTGTVTIVGTQAQINLALATLVYTPTNNFSGPTTITVTTNDQGQGGNGNPGNDPVVPREAGGVASPDALQDVDVINLTVAPRSDAPLLTIGNTNPGGTQNTSPPARGTGLGNSPSETVSGVAAGLEDTAINLGIKVLPADATGTAEVIQPTITITGIPAGWVLKDAAGNDITAAAGSGLTPVQATGATLTPPAHVYGPALATLTVTVTSKDGADAVATTKGTLIINVAPVNDAPLFPATTTTVLPAFDEDTVSGSVTVQTAFPGYTDANDAGKPNGPDNRVGVLITSNAATAAQGNWQYFDGANWLDVPRNVSDTNALYLPDGTQIRFNPAPQFNGTPGNLAARLVEDDQAGPLADLPANGTGSTFGPTNVIRPGLDLSAGVGGTSRVSDNTRDVSITVTPVNDPPVVTVPTATLNVGDVPISFTGPNAIVITDPADTPFVPNAIVKVTITPTANGRPFISSLTPGVTQTSGPPVGSIPAGPGTPIVLSGTIADINATLANLEYRSAAFFNGPDSFTVKIEDLGNGGPIPLQDIKTVNVANIPLNDRPVPIGSTADYEPLYPGETTNGRTVQELFGTRFTDPRDAPSTNGGDTFAAIAVISTPLATQGIYQYSTNGGATWIPIAAGTTSANSLVLEPTALIRFVANPGFIGTTTPLQAVLIETDQPNAALPSQGDLLNRGGIPFDTASSAPPTTGTVINLSSLEVNEAFTTTNGIGRSRFSNVTNPMTVGVRIDPLPINDRPVLTDNTPIDLGKLPEGSLASAPQNVGALFGPRFSDPIDAGERNGADVFKGVFITGSAANPVTEGTWEYSIDGGTTFTAVPSTTSDGSAIYLSSSNLIRFKPVDSNYSGTPGQLTARLVETEQSPSGRIFADVLNGAASGTTIGNSIDSLAPGAVVNIAAPVGNPSQFATGRVSEPLNVGIVITPVSDAPVLTIGAGPQEPGNPTGTTGVQSSPGSPPVGNNATGAVTGSVRGLEDTAIPLGIKVVPADNSNPEAVTTVTISGVPPGWVLTQADGTVIPTPGGSTAGLTPAQVLGATITPPTDVNGTGAVGSSPAATLIITVSSKDGAEPPAVTTGTLNVAVTPVNDAPAFPSTDTTALPAGTANSPSAAVSVAAAFPGFVDAKDAGKTNGSDNRVGVLITSNASTPAQGNWQYFDGVNWIDVPRNVSDTNALYLPDGTQIRFNPAAAFSGTPGNLAARLIEDDQPGSRADLPANTTGSSFGPTNAIRPGVSLSAGVGGTSRVSANTRDVGISILAVPAPPAPPVDPIVQPPVGPPIAVGPTPPVPPSPVALNLIAPFAPTLLPDVLAGGPLAVGGVVGQAVRAAQAEAALADAVSSARFAENLGNSGLQPNWLMPEGIPGLDPFNAPLPELDPKAIVETPIAPRNAMTAEEIARQIECAKPRVVAKPRPPGYVARPAPKFEPGSPAAKRFSEQLKRARARARC